MRTAPPAPLLLLLAATAACAAPPLQHRVLDGIGSHYELGVRQGTAQKGFLREYLATSDDLRTRLLPFCRGANGTHACAALWRNAEAAFPLYVQELRGIADGGGVRFEDVMLLNMADEIHSLMGGFPHHQQKGACSSVINRTAWGSGLIGHNEDGGHCISPPEGCYLLSATPLNQSAGPSFTAFTYPAMLPGYAFSFNSHGVGFSVNSEFVEARFVNVASGVPNLFLTRDLLRATSTHDALRRIKSYSVASGFTMNLGSSGAGRLFNVEVGPGVGNVSILEVPQGGLATHFNQYLRLPVPEYPDTSSDRRRLRAAELLRRNASLLQVLGDTGNPPYNIWRDYSRPKVDHCQTVATAVFDFEAGALRVYTENPVTHPRPQYSLAIPCGEPVGTSEGREGPRK